VLLQSLTSSLGLLAVATLIVDFLMGSCLPLRNIYRQYKVTQSLDFTDVEHLPRDELQTATADDPVTRMLRRMGRRRAGDGVARRRGGRQSGDDNSGVSGSDSGDEEAPAPLASDRDDRRPSGHSVNTFTPRPLPAGPAPARRATGDGYGAALSPASAGGRGGDDLRKPLVGSS
jgi:hypothetical protein